MAEKGPIILIDDDVDEHELIGEVLIGLGIKNKLICFVDGRQAYQYLKTTAEQPFLILTDINMPEMNGLELRKRITEDEELRGKAIPFIFLTTTATSAAINEAYKMSVQGFFEKGHNIQEIGKQISDIYNYWQKCRHPNK